MSMDSSDRCAYIGVNVRPEVKAALKQVADASGRSVSLLVSDICEAALTDWGMDITPKPEVGDALLPLDGHTKVATEFGGEIHYVCLPDCEKCLDESFKATGGAKLE